MKKGEVLDITGWTWGKWTVLERDFSKNNHHGAYWLCKCECGAIKSISAWHFLAGRTKSCVLCAARERSKKALQEKNIAVPAYKTKKFPKSARKKYGCKLCADRKECVKRYCQTGQLTCLYADELDQYKSYADYEKENNINFVEILYERKY